MITNTLNSNVFHVMKHIPYQKKKRGKSQDGSWSSSSKSNESGSVSNISYSTISTVSSKTDSELNHVSTPSDTSSASSREDLDKVLGKDDKNLEKMEKKVKFSFIPLYLDDT